VTILALGGDLRLAVEGTTGLVADVDITAPSGLRRYEVLVLEGALPILFFVSEPNSHI